MVMSLLVRLYCTLVIHQALGDTTNMKRLILNSVIWCDMVYEEYNFLLLIQFLKSFVSEFLSMMYAHKCNGPLNTC